MTPFSRRVADGLKARGLTLRELCRAVRIDPSFFSKVLAGKRSPPVEEDVLRRIAAELALDPAELIVSAGRIPSEWAGLLTDPQLFAKVNRAFEGSQRWDPSPTANQAKPVERKPADKPKSEPRVELKRPVLSEELL